MNTEGTREFQPGEVVEVRITGTVVEPRPGDSEFAPNGLRIRYHELERGIWAEVHVADADAPSVFVQRVAPPEWPPQQGDLWRDRFGSVWFCSLEPARHDEWGPLSGRELRMSPGDPSHSFSPMKPDKVLEKQGPLALVHREARNGGESDG